MAAQAPKKQYKFVIDDPRKVEVIEDRGEAKYREEKSKLGRPRAISTTKVDQNVIFDVSERLGSARLACPLNRQNEYIPRAKFDEIVTPETVFQIVSTLDSFMNEDVKTREKRAAAIYYGNEPHHGPLRKLLCVLLLIEKQNELQNYMAEGMSDNCLPLILMPTEGKNGLLDCRLHKHGHPHINKQAYSAFTRRFFASLSRTLMPPYIYWEPGSRHRHYVLEEGDPFPVVKDNGKGVGVGAMVSGEGRDNEGGFSEVIKVRIDEGCGSFGRHQLQNVDRFFALKKLKRHPNIDAQKHREEFDLEVETSIYAGTRADKEALKHPDLRKHLVPLLATFEIRNPYNTDERTYYLLFDWADGNLKEFWQEHKEMVRDQSQLEWMASQFTRLARALQCIHNDSTRYRSDKTWSWVYGRHGDIKPSNFLYFKVQDDKPVIAIGDLGLGRLHRDTSLRQDPKNIATTITYRAPEFEFTDGRLTPSSDIYSMGCVFAEHITWFMLGYDGVKQFAQARMTPEVKYPDFYTDIFFSLSEDLSTPMLKPEVSSWIRRLQDDEICCEYLKEMLDLIGTEMLESDPQKRISAVDLVRKLTNLEKRFPHSPSFYGEHWTKQRRANQQAPN